MVGVGGGSGLEMPESGVISLIFSCSLLVCLSHFLFYSLSYLLLLLFLSLSSSPLNQSISQQCLWRPHSLISATGEWKRVMMEVGFLPVEEGHDGKSAPPQKSGMMGSLFSRPLKRGMLGAPSQEEPRHHWGKQTFKEQPWDKLLCMWRLISGANAEQPLFSSSHSPVSFQGSLSGFCPGFPVRAVFDQLGEESVGLLGFRFPQKEFSP